MKKPEAFVMLRASSYFELCQIVQTVMCGIFLTVSEECLTHGKSLLLACADGTEVPLRTADKAMRAGNSQL